MAHFFLRFLFDVMAEDKYTCMATSTKYDEWIRSNRGPKCVGRGSEGTRRQTRLIFFRLSGSLSATLTTPRASKGKIFGCGTLVRLSPCGRTGPLKTLFFFFILSQPPIHQSVQGSDPFPIITPIGDEGWEMGDGIVGLFFCFIFRYRAHFHPARFSGAPQGRVVHTLHGWLHSYLDNK